jgi:hypothetical protein
MLHNCMVDSNAPYNVIPYVVCQKLDAKPKKSYIQIIQLGRSTVNLMGELKNVFIILVLHPFCHLNEQNKGAYKPSWFN